MLDTLAVEVRMDKNRNHKKRGQFLNTKGNPFLAAPASLAAARARHNRKGDDRVHGLRPPLWRPVPHKPL